MDKVSSNVNHEANAGEGGAALNPATEVVGKDKGFNGNALS